MAPLRCPRALGAHLSLLAALAASVVWAPPARSANPAAPSAGAPPAANLPSLHWNAISRLLVSRNRADPLFAVRTYALVSIAQHDALLTIREPTHATDGAAVASASAVILAHQFPNEVPYLANALRSHLDQLEETASDSVVLRGADVGRVIADSLLRLRRDDGWDNLSTHAAPRGAAWASNPRSSMLYPLRPNWGAVRPMLLADGQQFRSPPPPAPRSEEFLRALTEVRNFARNRTREQTRAAYEWEDGAGTATPPGHWNAIASMLSEGAGLSDRESARVLAIMNIAMFDASIACWDTKFYYWYPRPSQADTSIRLSVPQPNFPSYPSGHAVFSGAASAVLAARFPENGASLRRLAADAAWSRVLAGIHFRFDGEAGLDQGRSVAQWLLLRVDGSRPLMQVIR